MNNWLNKLERKYGRYGIPNLTNILVAGQILVLAIELFVDRTITGWLGLNRFLLLQGQVWRVISFIFIPFSGGSILSVVLGKNAACLLTISDSFVSPEITTAEQRQKSFTDMMKVALGAEY